MLRRWIGPNGFGQLLDAFFLPLVIIWVGARVAPSAKGFAALALALLYVATNVWQYAQLAQAGVTLERAMAGDAGMLIALAVLQILGVATGVYLGAFRLVQTVPLALIP